MPTSGLGIDLGAGRGEMLQVMDEAGLNACGIDTDESAVLRAKERRRGVRVGDAIETLLELGSNSVQLVTAIHLVEPLEPSTLVALISEIERVLTPGGVCIIETPNPHAIDAFKAF